jgi:UDP-2,3-diacylglucosamine hydrolase
MTYLFVSDLHLDGDSPAALETFVDFLASGTGAAAALYILGDLFETWIGDDDPDPARDRVCRGLARLCAAGTPVFVMRGNRDFMLGPGFESRTGCHLLPDPVVAELHGRRILLTHGDLLCTADHAYQELRSTVRDPAFAERMLRLPTAHRQALASAARAGSRAHTATAQDSIMDVEPAAVLAALRSARADCLVHGHTHRPGIHELAVDGHAVTRLVLDAWHEHGSVLALSPQGWERRLLEFRRP